MLRASILSRNRVVMSDNQRNLSRVVELQEQLSSGKRVQNFSDDPISARRALGFRVEQFRAQRFQINVERADVFLNATDATLAEMENLLDGIKEIAVEGANGTLDDASRQALADSADAHLSRMIDLANTTNSGRFIFAGTDVFTKPFELSADGTRVDYLGNLDDIEVNISNTERTALNQNGYRLFKEQIDVFDVMIELRDALEANDAQEVGNLISAVDEAHAHIGTLRGEGGGRMQRLELAQRQLEQFEVQVGELISSEVDVDLAEAIMELQTSQVALEAGLQASSRVLQPTLLDFL